MAPITEAGPLLRRSRDARARLARRRLDRHRVQLSSDLTRVDEIGFVDLMPSSGHGWGGFVNVGKIEVYGKPVKR